MKQPLVYFPGWKFENSLNFNSNEVTMLTVAIPANGVRWEQRKNWMGATDTDLAIGVDYFYIYLSS